jgi:hypothetical protein
MASASSISFPPLESAMTNSISKWTSLDLSGYGNSPPLGTMVSGFFWKKNGSKEKWENKRKELGTWQKTITMFELVHLGLATTHPYPLTTRLLSILHLPYFMPGCNFVQSNCIMGNVMNGINA